MLAVENNLWYHLISVAFSKGHSGPVRSIQTHTQAFLPNFLWFRLHPCRGGNFCALWRKVKGTDQPSGTRSVSPASFIQKTVTESWHCSLAVSGPVRLCCSFLNTRRRNTLLCVCEAWKHCRWNNRLHVDLFNTQSVLFYYFSLLGFILWGPRISAANSVNSSDILLFIEAQSSHNE